MKKLEGVALILFARDTGRIAILKELVNKPKIAKKAGMISPPLETIKKGEGERDALKRLLQEEMGLCDCCIDSSEFLGELKFPATEIVLGYTIYTFSMMCESEFTFYPEDYDIKFFGWMKMKDLISLPTSKRRREVVPILTEYFSL